MNEKYYPKEIEIVSSYINQFNYSNKYISVKELESLLKKDVPLSRTKESGSRKEEPTENG